MAVVEALLQEWESEAKTTRRVLERVPEKHLNWKPHAKSMSLGELALHLAESPGMVASWALTDVFEFPASFEQAEATSQTEILTAHDAGATQVQQVLGRLGDAGLMTMWKGVAPTGETYMEMPKIGLMRVIG